MGNTEQFDAIANIYDTPARISVAQIIVQAIRKYLHPQHDIMLDFGCGTGLIGLNFTSDVKSVVFMDSSKEMINVVENKIKQHNVDNASTICIDIEKGNYIDTKVDCIVMSQVLLHIKDTKQILIGLYEMLNDNGQLIIVDYVKNTDVVSEFVHSGFELDALQTLLKNVGYNSIVDEIFYTGKNNFMGRDSSLFVLSASK